MLQLKTYYIQSEVIAKICGYVSQLHHHDAACQLPLPIVSVAVHTYPVVEEEPIFSEDTLVFQFSSTLITSEAHCITEIEFQVPAFLISRTFEVSVAFFSS